MIDRNLLSPCLGWRFKRNICTVYECVRVLILDYRILLPYFQMKIDYKQCRNELKVVHGTMGEDHEREIDRVFV